MKAISLRRFSSSSAFVLMFVILTLDFEYAWADNCHDYLTKGQFDAPDCLGRTKYVLVPIAVVVGIVVGGLLGKGFAAPILEKHGEHLRESVKRAKEVKKGLTKVEVDKLVEDVRHFLIDDPGRDRALELILHRYLGKGTPFKKDNDDVEWSEFMRARPEIRGGDYFDEEMKTWKSFEGGLQLYERLAKKYAKEYAGKLEKEPGTLGWDTPHKEVLPKMRLSELQSMRLTLYEVHEPGIQINGRVEVSSIQYQGTDGYHIKFDDTWRWRDDLSLEKTKSTLLKSRTSIDDQLIENIEKLLRLPGQNYPIDISWNVRSEWFVDKMGNVTKLMGWPL